MQANKLFSWCIAFVFATGILGCRQVDSHTPMADTGILEADRTSDESLTLAPTIDSLHLLPFDSNAIRSMISWEGILQDGAHWEDKSGEHYLVISDLFQGEISDVSLVAKVNARQFLKGRDSLKLEWEIKEVNQNYFTNPEYSFKTLEITDLDRDGFAESTFIYQIDSDGADPCKVKLMMHVKGTKYAIRGQFAGMDYDVGEVEEKKIDPSFYTIPPVFEQFASQKWDDFEKTFYDSWKEDSE